MNRSAWTYLLALTVSLITISDVSNAAEEQKLKPEELVARHLDAVGLLGDGITSLRIPRFRIRITADLQSKDETESPYRE